LARRSKIAAQTIEYYSGLRLPALSAWHFHDKINPHIIFNGLLS